MLLPGILGSKEGMEEGRGGSMDKRSMQTRTNIAKPDQDIASFDDLVE